MERYLLFDASCLTCSALARSIESETQGWLIARSLHESEMQQLLTQAKPGWKWEPTILEVEENHVQVFTGVSLRLKLVAGLGLQKAWHIAQLVYQVKHPARGYRIRHEENFFNVQMLCLEVLLLLLA